MTAFAHLLPVRETTLREKAERLIAADAALNDPSCPDTDWDRRSDEQFDARADFEAALDAIGLDAPLRASLGIVL